MNEKYLIISMISIIVLLCVGIGYMFFVDQTEYISKNIAESGTIIEIPDDMILKS